MTRAAQLHERGESDRLPGYGCAGWQDCKRAASGIQILGPYLEDATPIRLAGLLAKENGGFTPPSGY